MTDLEKPVIRRTRAPYAYYRKRIVIILEPGDVVAMRLERSGELYRAPIASVYRQMGEWHVEAARREKRQAGKEKGTCAKK